MKKDHPFIHHFQNSFSRKNFVKLVLSKKRVKTALIKIVTFKPVQLKDEILVSMVISNQNNDITKNFTLEQSVFQLLNLLVIFYKHHLFV